jgi:hypothetical protein
MPCNVTKPGGSNGSLAYLGVARAGYSMRERRLAIEVHLRGFAASVDSLHWLASRSLRRGNASKRRMARPMESETLPKPLSHLS